MMQRNRGKQQNGKEHYIQKNVNDKDNQNGLITHLEPDIL